MDLVHFLLCAKKVEFSERKFDLFFRIFLKKVVNNVIMVLPHQTKYCLSDDFCQGELSLVFCAQKQYLRVGFGKNGAQSWLLGIIPDNFMMFGLMWC